MELTIEQKKIIEGFLDGENIKINAFAGSGKTTILRLLAEQVPSKKILVLTFNRAIKEELQSKFPSNCDVYTLNGFAYKFYNMIFDEVKLANSEREILPLMINCCKNLDYRLAWFYFNVYKLYLYSDLGSIDEIGYKDLIKLIKYDSKILKSYNILAKNYKNFNLKTVKKYLKFLYFMMENQFFPILHDFYVKWFDLKFNLFENIIKYDAVFVDEAQDLNFVIGNIIDRINAQKVIVGDIHQNIYARRGSYGIMNRFNFTIYPLTYSFRVSENIANKANIILNIFKGEKNKLKPFFKDGGKKNGKTGLIFRTNAGIVGYIASLDDSVRISTLRSLDEIFKTSLEMEVIKRYYNVKDDGLLDDISEFLRVLILQSNTFEEFMNYICNVLDDVELCSAAKIVLKYSIQEIYERAKNIIDKKASIVLSTAHSVKGLEFDEVVIFNDFRDIIGSMVRFIKNKDISVDDFLDKLYNGEVNYELKEIIGELNLVYVALTRAKKKLDIQSTYINQLLKINTINKLRDSILTKLKR